MVNRVLLYHITHLENLASILQKGELMAHSKVNAGQLNYNDIAHHDIQSRRSTTSIDIAPYGILHDYVPFYFAPRSPMLYTIKNGNVKGFYGDQSDIIYLISDVEQIVQSGRKFVFTDGHAIMALTEFYNDLSYLNKIDWEVMKSKYWFDTDDFPDRKRRRQAEFLVKGSLPLKHFLGIGVYNDQVKQKVNEILDAYNTEMEVRVRPSFYY